MSEDDAPFGDSFGQRVDLCVRLREILRSYPEGLSILKELLQNADDAGARTVRLVLDTRSHSTANLPAGLAVLQGAALLAWNDAVFTDADFAAIQRVGDSAKRDDSRGRKTGRFGIGFNSVYHLTDVPAFASATSLVFLDPSGTHLPGAGRGGRDPGARLDWSTPAHAALIKKSPAQFADPFCVWGCDPLRGAKFAGTLFRLPLRSAEEASTSRLSSAAHSLASVRALLRAAGNDAHALLLFLKSVEELSVWEWGEGVQSPVCMSCTRLELPSQREARDAVRASRGAALGVATALIDYSLRFITSRPDTGSAPFPGAEEWGSAPEGEACHSEWRVVAGGGGGQSAADALAARPDLKHLSLVVHAGVAARVRGRGGDSAVQGAYCFLPLPVRTGLPVAVNGFFDLSINRRELWWDAADMGGEGAARAAWNRALLESVAAVAYARLLTCLRDVDADGSAALGALPLTPLGDAWSTLAFATLKNAAAAPFLLPKSVKMAAAAAGVVAVGDTRGWVAPRDAIILADDAVNATALVALARLEGLSAIALVAALAKALAPFSRPLTPALVRDTLRAGTPAASSNTSSLAFHSVRDVSRRALEVAHPSLAHAVLVKAGLSFVLREAADAALLIGLPLLLLADGGATPFTKLGTPPPALIAKSALHKLLAASPTARAYVVASDATDEAAGGVKLLASAAVSSATQVRVADAADAARLLPLAAPPAWIVRSGAACNARRHDGGPNSESWLHDFWSFLRAEASAALASAGVRSAADARAAVTALTCAFAPVTTPASGVTPARTGPALALVPGACGSLRLFSATLAESPFVVVEGITALDTSALNALRAGGVLVLDTATLCGDAGEADAAVRHLISCVAHECTLRGVARALLAAAGGIQGARERMATAPKDARRALASWIISAAQKVTPDLLSDAAAPEVSDLLRALPLWDVYTGSAVDGDGDGDLIALDGGPSKSPLSHVHSDAPEPVVELVRTLARVAAPRAWIKSPPSANAAHTAEAFKVLGVAALTCAEFLVRFALPAPPTVSAIASAVPAERAALAVSLASALPSLPPAVARAARISAWVPDSGPRCLLHAASGLFDPSDATLRALLPVDAFPARELANEDGGVALDVLRALGLARTVSDDVVLRAACSAAEGSDVSRGSALLAFLDAHADEHLYAPPPLPPTSISTRASAPVGFFGALFGGGGRDAENSRDAAAAVASIAAAADARRSALRHALADIAWVPVVAEPPISLLPWPPCPSNGTRASLVRPGEARLPSDAWAVSATARIIDAPNSSVDWLAADGVPRWTTGGLSPGLSKFFAEAHAAAAPSAEMASREAALQLLALAKLWNAACISPPSTATSSDAVSSSQADFDAIERVLGVVAPRLAATALAAASPAVKDSLREPDAAWLWVPGASDDLTGRDVARGGFLPLSRVALRADTAVPPLLCALPSSLAQVRTPLRNLGALETFGAPAFRLAAASLLAANGAAPLSPLALAAILALAQHFADSRASPQPPFLLPDADGVLAPADTLTVDDAPWLQGDARTTGAFRFVHASVSAGVGASAGAGSLRVRLLAAGAGAGGVEMLASAPLMNASLAAGAAGVAAAFGQSESLTRRLRALLADNPDSQVWAELVANADDAGAKVVRIALDPRSHSTGSLLAPGMSALQGPALLVFNDAVFSEADFMNLARIGQGSKMASANKTGRFGLGFNTVYSLTDTPQLVSADSLIIFDPHCTSVPGATPAAAGLRIRFAGAGGGAPGALAAAFPDQFAPFRVWGCSLASRFDGTLFRLPLRSRDSAARSEIRRAWVEPSPLAELLSLPSEAASAARAAAALPLVPDDEDAPLPLPAQATTTADLLASLRAVAARMLPFLRSVERVEAYVWGGDALAPENASKDGFALVFSATSAGRAVGAGADFAARESAAIAASAVDMGLSTRVCAQSTPTVDALVADADIADAKGDTTSAALSRAALPPPPPAAAALSTSARARWASIGEFLATSAGASRAASLAAFAAAPAASLPKETLLIRVSLCERGWSLVDNRWVPSSARTTADSLLVHARVGAGRARAMATDPAHFDEKFVPAVAVATRLARRVSESGQGGAPVRTRVSRVPPRGAAFATLPLPVATGGLVFDVSAGFELSTNRRELWVADPAATGAARVRAAWNAVLLLDVAAPAVGRALVDAAKLITACGGGGACVCVPKGDATAAPQPACARPPTRRLADFYARWPPARVTPPWDTLATRLLELLQTVPSLFSRTSPEAARAWAAWVGLGRIASEMPAAPVSAALAKSAGAWVALAHSLLVADVSLEYNTSREADGMSVEADADADGDESDAEGDALAAMADVGGAAAARATSRALVAAGVPAVRAPPALISYLSSFRTPPSISTPAFVRSVFVGGDARTRARAAAAAASASHAPQALLAYALSDQPTAADIHNFSIVSLLDGSLGTLRARPSGSSSVAPDDVIDVTFARDHALFVASGDAEFGVEPGAAGGDVVPLAPPSRVVALPPALGARLGALRMNIYPISSLCALAAVAFPARSESAVMLARSAPGIPSAAWVRALWSRILSARGNVAHVIASIPFPIIPARAGTALCEQVYVSARGGVLLALQGDSLSGGAAGDAASALGALGVAVVDESALPDGALGVLVSVGAAADGARAAGVARALAAGAVARGGAAATPPALAPSDAEAVASLSTADERAMVLAALAMLPRAMPERSDDAAAAALLSALHSLPPPTASDVFSKAVLRALPLWPTADGGRRALCGLPPPSLSPPGAPPHLLPPATMNPSPLSANLLAALGAPPLDEPAFWIDVCNRVASHGATASASGSNTAPRTDAALLAALAAVSRMIAADSTKLSASLAASRIVPVATVTPSPASPSSSAISTLFARPAELFDPSVPELVALLPPDAFPQSGDLCSGQPLAALRALGLQTTLTADSLILAARRLDTESRALQSVSTTAGGDAAAALCSRGAALVRALSSMPVGALTPSLAKSLANFAWLPVMTVPPSPLLPWPSSPPLLAEPTRVREADDAWLASATHALVLPAAHSLPPVLTNAWGWRGALSAESLSHQLFAIASKHRSPSAREAAALTLALPPIYDALASALRAPSELHSSSSPPEVSSATSAFDAVSIDSAQRVLASREWVWVGDRFSRAEAVAKEPPPGARAAGLYGIPVELARAEAALCALGVADSFHVSVVAAALARLADSSVSTPVTEDGSAFAAAAADAIASAVAADSLSTALKRAVGAGALPLLDSASKLVPARSLLVMDAPWLGPSLLAAYASKGVSTRISIATARALGAGSLREAVLAAQGAAAPLPCVSARAARGALSRLGGARATLRTIMRDAVEVGDALGARGVSLLVDARSYSAASVLAPGLERAQGPALCLLFEGISIDAAAIVGLCDPVIRARKAGGVAPAGVGLLSLFAVADVVLALAANRTVVVDPAHVALAADGDAAAGDGALGVARTFATSVAFTDALKPFFSAADALAPESLGTSRDRSAPAVLAQLGTFIRAPLRDAPSALSDLVLLTAGIDGVCILATALPSSADVDANATSGATAVTAAVEEGVTGGEPTASFLAERGLSVVTLGGGVFGPRAATAARADASSLLASAACTVVAAPLFTLALERAALVWLPAATALPAVVIAKASLIDVASARAGRAALAADTDWRRFRLTAIFSRWNPRRDARVVDLKVYALVAAPGATDRRPAPAPAGETSKFRPPALETPKGGDESTSRSWPNWRPPSNETVFCYKGPLGNLCGPGIEDQQCKDCARLEHERRTAARSGGGGGGGALGECSDGDSVARTAGAFDSGAGGGTAVDPTFPLPADPPESAYALSCTDSWALVSALGAGGTRDAIIGSRALELAGVIPLISVSARVRRVPTVGGGGGADALHPPPPTVGALAVGSGVLAPRALTGAPFHIAATLFLSADGVDAPTEHQAGTSAGAAESNLARSLGASAMSAAGSEGALSAAAAAGAPPPSSPAEAAGAAVNPSWPLFWAGGADGDGAAWNAVALNAVLDELIVPLFSAVRGARTVFAPSALWPLRSRLRGALARCAARGGGVPLVTALVKDGATVFGRAAGGSSTAPLALADAVFLDPQTPPPAAVVEWCNRAMPVSDASPALVSELLSARVEPTPTLLSRRTLARVLTRRPLGAPPPTQTQAEAIMEWLLTAGAGAPLLPADIVGAPLLPLAGGGCGAVGGPPGGGAWVLLGGAGAGALLPASLRARALAPLTSATLRARLTDANTAAVLGVARADASFIFKHAPSATLPPHWAGLPQTEWLPGVSGAPSEDWVRSLWVAVADAAEGAGSSAGAGATPPSFLDTAARAAQQSGGGKEGWPLLPVRGVNGRRLVGPSLWPTALVFSPEPAPQSPAGRLIRVFSRVGVPVVDVALLPAFVNTDLTPSEPAAIARSSLAALAARSPWCLELAIAPRSVVRAVIVALAAAAPFSSNEEDMLSRIPLWEPVVASPDSQEGAQMLQREAAHSQAASLSLPRSVTYFVEVADDAETAPTGATDEADGNAIPVAPPVAAVVSLAPSGTDGDTVVAPLVGAPPVPRSSTAASVAPVLPLLSDPAVAAVFRRATGVGAVGDSGGVPPRFLRARGPVERALLAGPLRIPMLSEDAILLNFVLPNVTARVASGDAAVAEDAFAVARAVRDRWSVFHGNAAVITALTTLPWVPVLPEPCDAATSVADAAVAVSPADAVHPAHALLASVARAAGAGACSSARLFFPAPSVMRDWAMWKPLLVDCGLTVSLTPRAALAGARALAARGAADAVGRVDAETASVAHTLLRALWHGELSATAARAIGAPAPSLSGTIAAVSGALSTAAAGVTEVIATATRRATGAPLTSSANADAAVAAAARAAAATDALRVTARSSPAGGAAGGADDVIAGGTHGVPLDVLVSLRSAALSPASLVWPSSTGVLAAYTRESEDTRRALAAVACVPVRPPNRGGEPYDPASPLRAPRLVRYADTVVVASAELAWTVLPVLSLALEPPTAFAASVGVAPPRTPVVLAHIHRLTSASWSSDTAIADDDDADDDDSSSAGADAVTPSSVRVVRWTFTKPLPAVCAAIFAWLNGPTGWSALSPPARAALSQRALIPSADGTLYAPSRVFSRVPKLRAPVGAPGVAPRETGGVIDDDGESGGCDVDGDLDGDGFALVDLAPLMTQVPRVLAPYDALLRELGVADEPRAKDFAGILCACAADAGQEILEPNELLAALALAVAAAGAPRGTPLAVPDENGVLVRAADVFVADNTWLAERVIAAWPTAPDAAPLPHLLHHSLAPFARALGVPALSGRFKEVLAQRTPLPAGRGDLTAVAAAAEAELRLAADDATRLARPLAALVGLRARAAAAVAEKLRGARVVFAAAITCAVANVGAGAPLWGDDSLGVAPLAAAANDDVDDAPFSSALQGITCETGLNSRVLARSRRAAPVYCDVDTKTIHVAATARVQLPLAVGAGVASLLATIARVDASAVAAVVAAAAPALVALAAAANNSDFAGVDDMVSGGVSSDAVFLSAAALLRVSSSVDSGRGEPGEPLSSGDAARVRLDPLALFERGGIVAVRAPPGHTGVREQTDLVYARVIAIAASPWDAVTRVRVRTGPRDVRDALSTDIYTFERASVLAANRRAAMPPSVAAAAAAAIPPTPTTAAVPTAHGLAPPPAPTRAPTPALFPAAPTPASAKETAAALASLLERLGAKVDARGAVALADGLELRRERDEATKAAMAARDAAAQAAAAADATRAAWQCAICFAKDIDTAFVPCGHTVCEACARALPTRTCPFDRRAIDATIRIRNTGT